MDRTPRLVLWHRAEQRALPLHEGERLGEVLSGLQLRLAEVEVLTVEDWQQRVAHDG